MANLCFMVRAMKKNKTTKAIRRTRNSVSILEPVSATHARPVVPAKDRKLNFGNKWDYTPAPETVPVKIEPRYELFVDGKFVAPRSGKYFPTINPATEEKLSEIAAADA